MENYLGDLTDILRASGGAINNINTTTTAATTTTTDQISNWNFGSPDTTNDLRDLYTFPDPLSRDIDASSSSRPLLSMGADQNNIFSNIAGGLVHVSAPVPNNHHLNNLYSSRMVQISPSSNVSNNNNNNSRVKLSIQTASPKIVNSSFGFMANNGMMNINASCSTPGLEIPSPPNSGIKRRKNQAKKVVCIPAPAAANSRQTGEVVPSDLWAWRKYGQKPIKGSPYPRGYYRCSSSKGCLARKQVERSRTNSNMLVITYTSEHNHPWPTQRNALAGSSRSQTSKSSSSQSQAINDNVVPSSSPKDEVLIKEETNNHDRCYNGQIDKRVVAMSMVSYNTRPSTSTTLSSMKEEDEKGNDLDENINTAFEDDRLNNNYRPTIMTNQSNFKPQLDQDFFKDLVEFEGDDPLNLLFTQETKESDLFSGFLDWSQNIATTHNSQDCEQKNDSSSG